MLIRHAYDPPSDDRSAYYVQQFIQPELHFHAIMNLQQEFVGFCSFGADGQVPGGDYSLAALDIGLGMKPEYTGRGLGRQPVDQSNPHHRDLQRGRRRDPRAD